MRSLNICQGCGGVLTGEEDLYVEEGGDSTTPEAMDPSASSKGE